MAIASSFKEGMKKLGSESAKKIKGAYHAVALDGNFRDVWEKRELISSEHDCGICDKFLSNVWVMESRLLQETRTVRHVFPLTEQYVLIGLVLCSLFWNPEKSYIVSSLLFQMLTVSHGLFLNFWPEFFFTGLTGMYQHERCVPPSGVVHRRRSFANLPAFAPVRVAGGTERTGELKCSRDNA
eukprot:419590-Prorocentrum_minimum.AAC.5